MNIMKSVFGIIILSTCVSACSEVKLDAAPDVSAATSSKVVSGNPPIIQTPPPIIFLNDNLDEKDNLGWCFDTKGRGLTEQLHTHSCKPAGDDVLFSYDDVSGQIRSATYENKCAQIVDPNADVPFGLLACDENNPAQKFSYNADTFELHPRGQDNQCIAAGAASAAAGPYMSRSLLLAPCKDVEASLKQWTVLTGE